MRMCIYIAIVVNSLENYIDLDFQFSMTICKLEVYCMLFGNSNIKSHKIHCKNGELDFFFFLGKLEYLIEMVIRERCQIPVALN